MLRELKNVKQYEGEGVRRWFQDNYFDLILWFDDVDALDIDHLKGFQLCYDREDNERALTWYKPGFYSHAKIDDGETPFSSKGTPILVSDGIFDFTDIAEKFRAASGNIEQSIADLVYDKIMAYK